MLTSVQEWQHEDSGILQIWETYSGILNGGCGPQEDGRFEQEGMWADMNQIHEDLV